MDESGSGCGACVDAFSYNPGLIGANSANTGLLFLLNHSDSRALALPTENPYKSALMLSQTGRVLTDLLAACGLGLSDIYLTNAYKCLLPSDREPRAAEYASCRSVLERQVEEFAPSRIVVFGSPAFRQLFPLVPRTDDFASVVLTELDYSGIPSLVSWHPRTIWSMPKEKRDDYYARIASFLAP